MEVEFKTESSGAKDSQVCEFRRIMAVMVTPCALVSELRYAEAPHLTYCYLCETSVNDKLWCIIVSIWVNRRRAKKLTV